MQSRRERIRVYRFGTRRIVAALPGADPERSSHRCADPLQPQRRRDRWQHRSRRDEPDEYTTWPTEV